MLGLGLSPLGFSPLGFGVPDAATVPGGVIFPAPADVGVYESREQLDGRLVDPLTRDYAFDANGRVVGAARVPHLVQLALTTAKGSSAYTALGHDLASVQTITDNHQQRVEAIVRDALSALVVANLVALLAVDVQRVGTSGTALFVKYRDLTTGAEHRDRF